ncbi:MAG: hypothetical protein IPL23_16245 [Saprospiraceae bacterium]|nr:hypothetical protein [Saprospiraceae bacterium]
MKNLEYYNNLGMLFENFINMAFNCQGKFCDPLGYSMQENFIHYEKASDLEKLEFIVMINTALGVLAYRFPKEVNNLNIKDLIQRVNKIENNEDCGKVLFECINICQNLGL